MKVSNVIEMNGGIVLTLSDDVMNKLFGELLTSQVANLQRQVDTLAMTVARLETAIDQNDSEIESLRSDVGNIEESIESIDTKLDDMPDLDDMAGQIEELETNSNSTC